MVRWFTILVGGTSIFMSTLACTGLIPTAPVTRPMEAPDAVVLPELSSSLALTPEIEASILSHLEELQHSSSGNAAFCEAFVSSPVLADVLERHLAGVFEANPEGLAEALDALDAAVPGVEISLRSEGISAFFAPGQLGPYTDRNTATMMTAAGQVLPHPFPGWLKQTWDLGGCADPSLLGEPLARLSERYALAPECVKNALRNPLRQELESMSGASCWCASRPEMLRATDGITRSLERLPKLGGPRIIRQLKQTATREGTVFASDCAG